MSAPIQDRSITIIRPTTWRPRDQIPPAPPPTSTPPLIQEAEPEVLPLQEDNTRKNTKLKLRLKKVAKRIMRMAKRKQATKVHNTGVDTFSTSKHSFLNRMRFWKTYHPKSPNSLCEGCRSWKARLDPDVQNRSPTGDEVSEERANRLVTPSIVQKHAIHDGVQSMITPSEMSTSASAPIPISIPNTTKQSCCCSRRGRENQHDGNVGLDLKNAAFPNASVVSEGSLVNITVEDSPVLSSHHFLKSDESLPEDGQSPSPERGCLPIYEDLEDVSDFELSPLGLRCSGLSPDLLNVLNKMTSLIGPGLSCPPGVDLEAELKRAMESSLPRPEVEPETPSSPATAASDRPESDGEGSETSLAESFSRSRTSLPSNDGDSAPSHSFHIEKPYSHLGSDFANVEGYLVEPSASFPDRRILLWIVQPPRRTLDSSRLVNTCREHGRELLTYSLQKIRWRLQEHGEIYPPQGFSRSLMI